MEMRSTDVFGGTGLGVSDLERSAQFYTGVLGMQIVQTYNLERVDEHILTFEGRNNALLLMNFKDGREHRYQDNPVKLIFWVADIAEVFRRVREGGFEIVQQPAPQEILADAVVGFIKDPDGYGIEIIERSKVAQTSGDESVAATPS
jgi:lactoylglutathione lyase